MNNVTLALTAARGMGIRLIGINPSHIMNKDTSLTMGVIW